jgi:selenocysteine-specific elongation factor
VSGSNYSLVVGTAGHIDHGKTALVRALTGVDTDRLPEEKRRGITIELGFAPWSPAPDVLASIVDVPGHERFVHTMVAGVAGVDVALLVVAADDGVMPQTREHLDVLRLLGVQELVVVLSKCDLAAPDVIELVRAELQETLAKTPFAAARVVATSAKTGLGLAELASVVAAAARHLRPRPASGPVVVPVDRVFTMKGFGTVVTGTLVRGTLAPATTLFVAGRPYKVRGLESRGRSATEVGAGARVAINVSGDGEIGRGDVLSSSAALTPSPLLLVELRVLEGVRAVGTEEVSLHVGTSEALARTTPVGVRTIAPGGRGLCLVRPVRPLTAFAGQPLIVRRPGDSGARTVAGGVVVDPAPPDTKGTLAHIAALAEALVTTSERRLLAQLELARAGGITLAALPFRVPAGQGDPAALIERGEAITVGDLLVDARQVEAVRQTLAARAQELLGADGLRATVSAAELTSSLEPPRRHLAAAALARATELEARGEGYTVRGRAAPALDSPEVRRVIELLEKGGYAPPFDEELVTLLGKPAKIVQGQLASLRNAGRIVKVAANLHYDAATVKDVEAKVMAALAQKPELSAGDFKELLGGLSRKWAIPLLEFLDRTHVTVRIGNNRKLHASRRAAASGSR